MIDRRGNVDPAILQLHGADIAAMLHAHEHLAAAKIDRARRQDRTEADAARARDAPRHAGMRIERSTGESIGHDADGRAQRPLDTIAEGTHHTIDVDGCRSPVHDIDASIGGSTGEPGVEGAAREGDAGVTVDPHRRPARFEPDTSQARCIVEDAFEAHVGEHGNASRRNAAAADLLPREVSTFKKRDPRAGVGSGDRRKASCGPRTDHDDLDGAVAAVARSIIA